MNSRYRKVIPVKRHHIPLGWEGVGDVEEHACDLFEAALVNPIYDQNKIAWDAVLEFLNLPLCNQPAVAKVISEGRWRQKKNPKAYVATAAYTQGLRAKLKEFPDRTFKRIAAGEGGSDRDHGVDLPAHRSGDERLGDRDGVGESRFPKGFPALGALGQRHNGKPLGVYDDGSGYERIPSWLQHPNEGEDYDWCTVAAHAALKPGMVPFLALAMNIKFRHWFSREEAKALVSSFGLQGKIEAAYKWIEREDATRIAPLLKMQKPPEFVAALTECAPMLVRASKLADLLSKVALSWSYDRHLPGDVELIMYNPASGSETGFLAGSRKGAAEGLGALIVSWIDGEDIFRNGLLPPKMEQSMQLGPALKPAPASPRFKSPWDALRRPVQPPKLDWSGPSFVPRVCRSWSSDAEWSGYKPVGRRQNYKNQHDT